MIWAKKTRDERQHITIDPNALGGLDLEMPGPSQVWGSALRSAVDAGDVPETVIDDKVRRLLRVLAWSGRFDDPEEKPESSIDAETHPTRVAS